MILVFFFFQAEDGIRDYKVTGVQTCALPIFAQRAPRPEARRALGNRTALGIGDGERGGGVAAGGKGGGGALGAPPPVRDVRRRPRGVGEQLLPRISRDHRDPQVGALLVAERDGSGSLDIPVVARRVAGGPREAARPGVDLLRSEERRVGKGCRSRWA